MNAAAGELSSQPFNILLTLLSRAGDVVPTEELRRQIWGEDTFVDFEHGLHAAMNKLRRVLGDSAKNPHYIETVAGRGYRFIGAVEHRLPVPTSGVSHVGPTLTSSSAGQKQGGPPQRHLTLTRSWQLISVTAVTVSALCVWAASHSRKSSADERVLSLQMNPPDDAEFAFGTDSAGISLSPDGKMAAYVASHAGKNAVWVRSLDNPITRQLAGTDGAGLPFWSPDSRSIGFFAACKLQRVELTGGAPETICKTGVGEGGSWDSDGQILFAAWGSSIYQVAASGGKPSPVTTLDGSRGDVFHYWPQILPGGRFLYFVRSRKRENTGIYAASRAKPRQSIQLLQTDTNALYAPGRGDGKGYLLWLRGGALMAQKFDVNALKLSGLPHRIAEPVARMPAHGEMQVSVSHTGIMLYSAFAPLRRLTWVDRMGKPQGTLGDAIENSHFRLSPDGRRLVATRHTNDGTDLWMLDVGRAVWSRFTFRPGIDIYPVWSPDNRTVVFASDAPFNLFRKNASGSTSEQRLLQSPNPNFPMDWSHDGRFILYEQDDASGDRRSLWILPTAEIDGKPRPYLQTPFNNCMGHFSPDTRWVAFQSDETGRYEIYIDAFPESHGKVRISTSGGILPRWSASGRELFYVSPDFKLTSVALNVEAGLVQPSVPQVLFALPVLDADLSPYEVAPNGRRFLVLGSSERAAPLTVIVNWPLLLNDAPNGEVRNPR